MKNIVLFIWTAAVPAFLLSLPATTLAAKPIPDNPPEVGTKIEDYTAFPPFLPRVVSPNILFLLDYSQHMVRPAYGECRDDIADSNCKTNFIHLLDDFTANQASNIKYSGYFDPNWTYDGSSTQFTKASTSTGGEWSGSWLNWLTTTQFDLMKLVAVGGEADAAPETGNPHHVGSKNLTNNNGVPVRTMHKVVDVETCKANAPDSLCAGIAPNTIPYKWVETPESGVTTIFGTSNSTGGVDQIPLPFDFQLYGVTFPSETSISVNVNGWFTFTGGTIASRPNNESLPTANNYDYTIFPYWDNQEIALNVPGKSEGSSIKAFVTGTEPNRMFVLTFKNMVIEENDTGKDDPLTYQVLLFEGSNHIIFQYQDVQETKTHGRGRYATVGIQGSVAANEAVQYSFDEIKLVNEQAILMTPEVTIFTVETSNQETIFKPYSSTSTTDVFPAWITNAQIAKTGTPASCPSGSFLNKWKDACYEHPTEGLLQDFRDGELAGLLGFRLGIMLLNSEDGGKVEKHFNDKDENGWSSLINAVRNGLPRGDAPLAESLYEAMGYFKQNNSFDFGSDFDVQATRDPYYFDSAKQQVPCAKSYVLMISSGHYSHDNGTSYEDTTDPLFNFNKIADSETWDEVWSQGFRSTDDTDQEWEPVNGGWLDNVAYEMRTASLSGDDHRSESTLPGQQLVSLYAVDTYSGGIGVGTETLKKAARWGGFRDLDGNGNYDPGDCSATPQIKDEADFGCDGKPDTYFAASSGGGLKAQIVNAVLDILRNSASGTSVSVLSTSAGGEGALYQAYFYPAKIDDENNQYREARWPGYLRSFFIDRYQNLRDDYSDGGTPDQALVLDKDRIAMMFLADDNSVKVKLYADTNGDGKLSSAELTAQPNPSIIEMDDIDTLWEAGKKLAVRDTPPRSIYLWVDRDGDGIPDQGDFGSAGVSTGEALKLATNASDRTSQAAVLKPYFRASDSSKDGSTWVTANQESENLIDFILGKHVKGTDDADVAPVKWEYRGRCINVGVTAEAGCRGANNTDTQQRTWPLGDIVFSTPTLVASPAERYDKIYGDSSYLEFYQSVKNRRQVVYVGANDGMLHAFNGGVYVEGDKSGTADIEYGYFAPNPTGEVGASFGFSNATPAAIGDELWAFLPHDNLPHMPWLACNGSEADPSVCGDAEYTHVYYVDNRPKVTDARIFNATGFTGIDGQTNVTHLNGWGTILILSMRLGGGAMDVSADFGSGTEETRQFRSAYYALDVTDPEKPPRLLWRFNDPSLGFSSSYPTIVRIKEDDGTISWYMVVGSGAKNGTGENNRDYSHKDAAVSGKIFVVDLKTGTAVKTFDTETVLNSAGKVNIMGDATAVDVNRDSGVDVIYIGGSFGPEINSGGPAGRIFRINTHGDVPANWELSVLFDVDPSATNADPDNGDDMGPILVGPSVAKDNSGNLWVYFGSGQLKNRDDLANSDLQRFYGVKDKCWKSVSGTCDLQVSSSPFYAYDLNDLVNTSNARVLEISTGVTRADQVRIPSGGDNAPCGGTEFECSFQDLKSTIAGKSGWYVDMADTGTIPSERILSKSSVLGGVVLFTSYRPSGDMCSIFGDSWLNGLFYETGTAYSKSVIGSHLEDSDGNILTDSDGNPINGDDYVVGSGGSLVHKETGNAAPSGAVKVFDSKADIGQGMPTSVGVAIGESTSGFIQKSTGEIKQIQTDPAYKLKSGPFNWREESTGGGNAGVEVIYKHIVR